MVLRTATLQVTRGLDLAAVESLERDLFRTLGMFRCNNFYDPFTLDSFCRGIVMRRLSFSLLWVTPTTKSTNFGNRCLGEGSTEEDEIFQVARGRGVDVHHDPDW